MRCALITGGAGFLGSHLCRRLRDEGRSVVSVDNLITGRRKNLEDMLDDPHFTFIEQDVCEPLCVDEEIDEVFHLASLASPPAYGRHPIETLLVGSIGTKNALDLALQKRARFLLASTSEVYGDPEVSPQPEGYTGNVSTTGLRSVYDESKRYAEALTAAYGRRFGLTVHIARIFNTYGPGLDTGDGRVVPNFIDQALSGAALTVYGDGSQTRSFCYIDDLIAGLLKLQEVDFVDPVNLGNPDERSIIDLARLVIELTGSRSTISFADLPEGDPTLRRPDIERARSVLEWEPRVHLVTGLERTIDWFQLRLEGSTK